MGGSSSKCDPPAPSPPPPTPQPPAPAEGRGGFAVPRSAEEIAKARRAQRDAEAAAAAAISRPVLAETAPHESNVQRPSEGEPDEWLAAADGSFRLVSPCRGGGAGPRLTLTLVRGAAGEPFGLDVTSTNVVSRVREGSPAAAAGVRVADVVCSVAVSAAREGSSGAAAAGWQGIVVDLGGARVVGKLAHGAATDALTLTVLRCAEAEGGDGAARGSGIETI
ncbi:hypothetical protein EMIHUDRAFT_100799 [Emiliania huxleyi CCMP1516]|uniref:PDZ domain-containing protein n=2 Tax=Emiliania huxleyi TaxID=2903 RepID=A0A0D3JNH0_EMIH1|nr:hypothetical protein EMIHUDRAFT_100799 [Emiliania huxleyi CCMP1516]EOD25055.1 hypothetical protein EMIHUDRAFT_100799 [Emiliania huxleyi CCMP1516]|eukprot:XP_005777484.1 hypothetical protein EMIHUDRAFT_100799 [Emiliania huxleyi CCMP1516]